MISNQTKFSTFAVGLGILFATPSAAAVVMDFKSTAVGVSETIGLDGYFAGTTKVDPGLGGKLSLTLDSVANNVWTFSYSLTNTSTEQSRIGAIGWNIEELSGANVLTDQFTGAVVKNVGSNAFSNASLGGQMPSLDKKDLCLNSSNGSSCAGGGGGGPNYDDGVSQGELTLTFPSSVTTKQGHTTITTPVATPTELMLSDFGAHYQSLPKNMGSSTVGVGVAVNAVPEPATWALTVTGLAGLGAVLRRRRAQALAKETQAIQA